MKNQKGLIQIFLAVGIVFMLGLIGYLLMSGKNKKVAAIPTPYQVTYKEAQNEVEPIANDDDLNSASLSLDSSETAEIDAALNDLNSISSGF